MDINKKERTYDARYPLDLPQGVRSFLQDYWRLHRAAYEDSCFDALNVILDAKRAIDEAKLTTKQQSALHYVFIDGMTQEQAADVLGYASHKGVGNLIDRAIDSIAESQGYDEQAFKEWAENYYENKGAIEWAKNNY